MKIPIKQFVEDQKKKKREIMLRSWDVYLSSETVTGYFTKELMDNVLKQFTSKQDENLNVKPII